MGKKPIAIIISDFKRTGGMDMANFAVADYLQRKGYPLNLVAHHVDADLAERPAVVVTEASRPLNSNLLAVPFLARAGMRVARKTAAAGGRTIANGGNCAFNDVNWVHYVHAAYFAPSAVSAFWKLKNLAAYKTFLRAERKSIGRARLLIANSQRTRSDLVKLFGVDPARVHCVYYGISDRFMPPTPEQRAEARLALGWKSDRPVVAFVGALGDRRKGFDTLFQAWIELCKRSDWNANLVVIGYGAELIKWRERAADAGLSSRIDFLGFRSDVPKILHAADALVAPTRYEAYGLGVLEALSSGLPAIVSADAGVAEQYPASLADLLLHDPDDAAELARRLTQWRNRMNEYQSLVMGLSHHLRRRTWDVMSEDILRLLIDS